MHNNAACRVWWTSENAAGTITIDLYKNNAFHSTLGSADMAAGKFQWNIPAGLTPGSDYSIRIHGDNKCESS